MQKQKLLIGAIVIGIIIGIFLLFGRSTITPTPTTTSSPSPLVVVVEESLLVKEDSYQLGDANAPVTIVAFTDIQCPACAYVDPIAKQILDQYQGKVRLVFRHWPLKEHTNSQIAAEAAEAAGEQGKFWEMADKLLSNQGVWSQSTNPMDILVGYARELKLDVNQFRQAVEANKFAEKIERDRIDGNAAGVTSVPAYFISGKNEGYIKSFDEFKEKIEKALAEI